MKAYIDRIEGDIAVVMVPGTGELLVPSGNFGFAISEGQHIEIIFKPDPASQVELRKDIESLQRELLDRNKNDDEK